MASITPEQFDTLALVKEQKLDAIKWRELQVGAIYTIDSVEFIDTRFGEACILTLIYKTKVFDPSALINRLKRESHKPCPCFVRPNGQKQFKRNPNQSYHAFDLVLKKWQVRVKL